MSSCKGKSSLFVGVINFTLFTTLVLGLAGAGLALWFDHTWSADLHAILKAKPPVLTILADDGQILAKRGVRRPDIPLETLPDDLINAVISTEDRRFYTHYGVDPKGLARALWNNMTPGRRREGGSTITQQLVKNIFLTKKRTLTRKFRELMIALWLEHHYSKKQILQFYFNRVYFGAQGRNGIEAAARHYFNKPARALDLPQSAVLAGLLKAPTYYSPSRNLARSHQRAFVVLTNMVATGAISQAQADYAREQPALLNHPPLARKKIIGTEYALDWIMEQIKQKLGAIETDLIVKTTLNRDWQVKAQKMVTSMIERNRSRKHVDQAAAVLMDESGGVKLMIGGTSYRHSQFNRVTQARRQPGSSFKPIIYLAAMESGRTPNSIENDVSLRIKGWRPRNYARFHRGPVTLRKALASSINSIAAKLADDVGLPRIMATARRLGIKTPLKQRLSLALGSSEVTPLEMTGAYVPFMNGGYDAPPHIITEAVTPYGEMLYRFGKPRAQRILGREYVYDMNDMLGAVVRSGTGRRAQLEKHAVAGKTGTTQNYRDAWFIGYTGHYTCGIWSGNDDNSPTNKVSGGRLPALLWKQIMQMAHKDTTPRPLPGLGSRTTAQAMILEENLPTENIIIAQDVPALPALIEPAPDADLP